MKCDYACEKEAIKEIEAEDGTVIKFCEEHRRFAFYQAIKHSSKYKKTYRLVITSAFPFVQIVPFLEKR